MVSRSGLAALFVGVVAVASGCGDDTTSATPDLSTPASDQSVPHDLATLSCNSILDCVSACADDAACQLACRQAGSADARTRYGAFLGCIFASCGGGDGGVHECTSATDNQPICLSCLASVASAASMAGNSCHAEYADCAAN
jgi:hypothetical protein